MTNKQFVYFVCWLSFHGNHKTSSSTTEAGKWTREGCGGVRQDCAGPASSSCGLWTRPKPSAELLRVIHHLRPGLLTSGDPGQGTRHSCKDTITNQPPVTSLNRKENRENSGTTGNAQRSPGKRWEFGEAEKNQI